MHDTNILFQCGICSLILFMEVFFTRYLIFLFLTCQSFIVYGFVSYLQQLFQPQDYKLLFSLLLLILFLFLTGCQNRKKQHIIIGNIYYGMLTVYKAVS